MSTHDEDRLRRTLRAQADRGAPRPLDLDSVTATARGIRRRRTALVGLVAAGVVTLAVPAGLALTGTLDANDAPPVAAQSPSGSATPGPRSLVEVSLLDDAQPGGDAPSVPYLRGDVVVTPAGDRITVTGRGTAVGLALLGDRWLVERDLGDGRRTLDTVAADGRVIGSAPAQSGPELSDDGTVAAYVAENGDLHTMSAADGDLRLAAAADVGEYPQVAAVVGSRTCKEAGSESGGCTVLVNLGTGGVRSASSHGIVDEVPGFVALADVLGDRALGAVSATDSGSCSSLQDRTSGQMLWQTCENSFGALSPDGRHAYGYPAYTDGMGPKSVSIVDAVDGRELVRFADEGRTDTHVRDVVWESDSSLLLTVWDGEDRSWSVLRAGVDGTLAEVETGLQGGDMEPAVHLPTR